MAKPFPFLTSTVGERVSLSVILSITGTRIGAVVKGLQDIAGWREKHSM